MSGLAEASSAIAKLHAYLIEDCGRCSSATSAALKAVHPMYEMWNAEICHRTRMLHFIIIFLLNEESVFFSPVY